MKKLLNIICKVALASVWLMSSFLLPAFSQTSQINAPLSQKEFQRAELAKTIEEKRDALFDDPQNGQLHWSLAKLYIIQGSVDIAENELKRAMALGVSRQEMMVDLGSVYLMGAKTDLIISQISVDEAPLKDRGEVYLILSQAYLKVGALEAALENSLAASALLDESFTLNSTLGTIYNLYGNYQKAETNVDKALEFDPKNVEMLIIKGELVHRKYGSKQSYAYFERAVFYQPENLQAQIKMAGVLYNLKLDNQAMKHLKRILKSEKSHPLANFLAALISVRKNNISKAKVFMNNANDTLDDFAPALLLKAKLSYSDGSYAKAQQTLVKLLLINVDHNEARRLLGAALVFQNKNTEAINVLEYMVQHNSLEEVDYMLLATAYMQAGNYDKANSYFEKTAKANLGQVTQMQKVSLGDFEDGNKIGVRLKLNSLVNRNFSSNEPLIIRSYKAFNDKKYNQVFDNAVRIIEQNRRNPVGYNLLGLAYWELEKFDEARSNFRKAIDLDDNFNQARINIAKLDFGNHRKKAAIETLNDILERDPHYLQAYQTLADFAVKDHKPQQAESYFLSAIRAEPNSIEMRQNLIDFYFTEKNILKARNLGLSMIKDFPDHWLSYKAMGRINIADGDYGAAVINFESALQKNQSDQQTIVYLSDAYGQNNQAILARETLHKALFFVKNRTPIFKRLINLALSDGDFKDSYRFVEQLKLDENTKAMAFFYQGELNIAQNKTDDAIKSFESVLKAGGNKSEATAKLILAYGAADKGEQSIEIAKAWLLNNANDTSVRFSLAQIYMQSEEFDQARTQLREIINVKSNNRATRHQINIAKARELLSSLQ